jgi:hypothetical protein
MRPLDAKDRVTKFCPAMGCLITLLVEVQNLQVKSLILAQIERWRRA